jgi:hypothetical protein
VSGLHRGQLDLARGFHKDQCDHDASDARPCSTARPRAASSALAHTHASCRASAAPSWSATRVAA